MKIGIILYSQTGNTLSVAEKLKNELEDKKYDVSLERVTIENPVTNSAGKGELKNIPKVDAYDMIIFASPVQAFSLAEPMKKYIKQLSSLGNKRVECFVTQHFPYPWMGGNHAIRQMKKICRSKGVEVEKTAVVNWTNKKRLNMIENLIAKLSDIS